MKINEIIDKRTKLLNKLQAVLETCNILIQEKNNFTELERNIEKKGSLIASFDEISKEIHSLSKNEDLTVEQNNLLIKQEEIWSDILKKDLDFKNQFEAYYHNMKDFLKTTSDNIKIKKNI